MKDVTRRILAFNESRLPEMRPLKYRSMEENAFRFFRGTCHLFYEDLAAAADFPSGPLGWICGDLHLENFGSYRSDKRFRGKNSIKKPLRLQQFASGLVA